jgi:isocitrate lyase
VSTADTSYVGDVVDRFVHDTVGVTDALVVSADGVGLTVSDGLPAAVAEPFGAIVAGLVSLTRGAARCFAEDRAERVGIELGESYLLVSEITAWAVLGVVARTDAEAAKLMTNDADEYDRPFILDQPRSSEGYYYIRSGIDLAIQRALAYAPYADMVWCETQRPDLAEAKKFAEAILTEFPNKLLAYNCSPSFNWHANLEDKVIDKFQQELGAMGYKFQFVTLAGFHSLNLGMFDLAREYNKKGMAAYAKFQDIEFAHGKEDGYMATTHQKFVGTGYFDRVMNAITQGESSVQALKGSTEEGQF